MANPGDRDDPIAPTAIAEEAEHLRTAWTAPPPEPSPSRQRIGRLIVGMTIGAVILLAAVLAMDASRTDADDPGWADIAFFVSPIIAIGSAIVLGLTLVIVAALRLVDLRVGRLSKATVLGVVVGPIVYIAGMVAIAVVLGDAVPSSTAWAFMTVLFPALCGLGVTLIAAFVRRPFKVSGWD
jgi:hypothetical protein